MTFLGLYWQTIMLALIIVVTVICGAAALVMSALEREESDRHDDAPKGTWAA